MSDVASPELNTYVVPEGFATRCAREYLWWTLKQPLSITTAVILVAGVGLVALDPTDDMLIPIALLALLIIQLILLISMVVLIWRSVSVAYPAGSVVRGAIDGDEIESETAVSHGRFNLSLVRRIVTTRSSVIFRLRAGAVAIAPRALFPDESIDALRRRISQRRASARQPISGGRG